MPLGRNCNCPAKKYIDRYYKFKKQEWEAEFYEYHELNEEDPNFLNEHRLQVETSQQVIVDKLKELKTTLESGSFKGWSFGNLEAIYFGQHLYQPLIHCTSELIDVTPVSLNQGEKQFVADLSRYHTQQKEFFADKELYLLRNMSKGRGIGFFEAGNFYPDFILWLFAQGKQYVTFIDPKGIRNLEGVEDPKIQFYQTIKELEAKLGDPNVVLNSFIVSVTRFQEVKWWTEGNGRDFLTRSHVFFQPDDNYVDEILKMILA